jgi:hypothetical protein
MVASIRQNIPKGKFRVIGVDLFDGGDYVVEDCDTQEQAFALADEHNSERTGSMDDVRYVYDDQGNYLRGEEAIKDADGKVVVGISAP